MVRPNCPIAGISLGLGTDGAASNNDLDMFREMDMTAKLHKVRLQDPTTLDAKTVLTLATRGGAEAIGLGDVAGSLEKGKQADIIILEATHPHLLPLHSPVSHAVYSARGSDVRDVLVAGRLVVENRELLSLPVEEVMAEVRGIGARIKE